MESLKKSSVQHLINYTALSESEVNYKTPTFCHGTSTNSEDYSYKSPKFAGTPQNSFLLDTTPQRLLKSDVSSHDKINETDKIDKDPNEFVGCNCKKSRCLKLYCECFANEKVCVKNCNCFDCKNNIQNQDIRKKAMNSILIKNPHAFSSKVSTRKEFSPLRNLEQKTFVKKGCNCKKSNCRKKYCECYGVGLKCTDICKCEDCKNKENSKKSSSASQSRKGDEDVLNEEQVTLFKLGKKGRDESEEEKNINGKNKKEDLETKKKKKRKK